MAHPVRSDRAPGLRIPLASIGAIPLEAIDSDAEGRDAAWRSFRSFALAQKTDGGAKGDERSLGRRDTWYDAMMDERAE